MDLQQKDLLGRPPRTPSTLRRSICYGDAVWAGPSRWKQTKKNSARHPSAVVTWSVGDGDRTTDGRINVQIPVERMSSLTALKSRKTKKQHPSLELWRATQPFTPQLGRDGAFSTSDRQRNQAAQQAWTTWDSSWAWFQFIFLWKNSGREQQQTWQAGPDRLQLQTPTRLSSFVDHERITSLPRLTARSLLESFRQQMFCQKITIKLTYQNRDDAYPSIVSNYSPSLVYVLCKAYSWKLNLLLMSRLLEYKEKSQEHFIYCRTPLSVVISLVQSLKNLGWCG